jgi:hypothetical protein
LQTLWHTLLLYLKNHSSGLGDGLSSYGGKSQEQQEKRRVVDEELYYVSFESYNYRIESTRLECKDKIEEEEKVIDSEHEGQLLGPFLLLTSSAKILMSPMTYCCTRALFEDANCAGTSNYIVKLLYR